MRTSLIGLLLLGAGCTRTSKDPGETTDEPCDPTSWYVDLDGDGWGSGSPFLACTAPEGFAAQDGDCDDHDPLINPGAEERCNGLDDDCDGQIDESGDPVSWYRDRDEDGYGDPLDFIVQCPQPEGYVLDERNCDDQDPAVHPGAGEYCNGIDDDCDGVIDNDDALDAATWYADADGDGYGDPAYSTTACAQPEGYVGNDQDCDDADPAILPGAIEVCDGLDNDCDGLVDDEDPEVAPSSQTIFYADLDGDGYGDPENTILACEQPEGYLTDSSDCNDADARAWPGDAVLTVPGDFSRIQDAIDAACALNTIQVAAGTYVETLDFGETELSLIGEGSEQTTIDGDRAGIPVLRMPGGRVEGFTIKNGLALTGGGVYAQGGDWLELADLHVTANTSHGEGGGLYIAAIPTLTFTDLQVSDNSSGSSGGGLYVALPSDGTLVGERLTVTGNLMDASGYAYGGGLFLSSGSSITISELLVSENSAASTRIYGAGVYSEGSADLSGAIVTGNSAMDGTAYGVGIYAGDDTELWGALISGNSTTDTASGSYGTGVYATGTVNLSQAWITDNSSTSRHSNYGTGIYASGTVDLSRTIITGNIAAPQEYYARGAGVVASGTIDLSEATVSDNTMSGDMCMGGGLYLSGTVELGGATITNNHASCVYRTYGVGVYANDMEALAGATIMGNLGSSEATVYGGLYAANEDNDLHLSDMVIAGNSGVGLYIEMEDPSIVADLVNLSIVGNETQGVGLLLERARQVRMTNLLIAFNGGTGVANDDESFEPTIAWSNLWENGAGDWAGMADRSGSNGNLAVDPLLSAFHPDADWTLWDLHLAPGSPLFDAGDPSLLDADGSVSEIGAWSGSDWYLDADGDGMYDGWETWHGLDPSADDSGEDPDGDGLSNLEEFLLGTWPNVADTDGDGVDDGDEVAAGTNPLVVD